MTDAREPELVGQVFDKQKCPAGCGTWIGWRATQDGTGFIPVTIETGKPHECGTEDGKTVVFQ